MRLLQTLMFILLFEISFSQTLLPEASLVKNAYEKLSMDPFDQRSRKSYIASFPSNSKVFLRVFNSDKFDQLYSASDKYIDALQQAADNFSREVISKCVDIGKNLTWDADAVANLQQASVTLAAKYPKLFGKKFNSLNDKEKDKLIRFYADAENHAAYPQFQILLDSLKRTGSSDIAKRLATARVNRKKLSNH